MTPYLFLTSTNVLLLEVVKDLFGLSGAINIGHVLYNDFSVVDSDFHVL